MATTSRFPSSCIRLEAPAYTLDHITPSCCHSVHSHVAVAPRVRLPCRPDSFQANPFHIAPEKLSIKPREKQLKLTNCSLRPHAERYRLLSHTIHTHLLDPALLPPALRAIRSAIFPNNAMGPPRATPSPEESLAIRAECARVLVEVIPPYVRGKLFATEDLDLMRRDVEASVLDLFADHYVNKHLIVDVVELIVVRLFPEVAET